MSVPRMRLNPLKSSINSNQLSGIESSQMNIKESFYEFCRSIPTQPKISLDVFCKFSDIQELINDSMTNMDIIRAVWHDIMKRTKQPLETETLHMDAAYQVLTDILLIANSQINFTSKDIEYFTEQFKLLSHGKSTITFDDITKWSEIKKYIQFDVFNVESLRLAWNTVTKKHATMDLDNFFGNSTKREKNIL